MWYAALGAWVILVLWMFWPLLRGYGSAESRDAPLAERLVMPWGLWMLDHRPGRNRRKHRESALEAQFIRLLGKTEGKERYRRFQARRIGTLTLGLIILFGFWLITSFPKVGSDGKENDLPKLERPAYGESARREKIRLTLTDGASRSEKTMVLSIPEKEMTEEEAQARLTEAMDYIRLLNGRKIFSSVKLPDAYQDVTFHYTSLSPEWIRADGTLLEEAGAERRTLWLRITGKIRNLKKSEVIYLIQGPLNEMSLPERMEVLARKIRQGDYLSEERMEIPETNEAGDVIVISAEEKASVFPWLIISLLAGLLVWFFQEQEQKNEWKKRDRQILLRLPELTGELSILTGAGLTLPACFIRLGRDYRQKKRDNSINYLYEEIARVGEEVEEGISLREALEQMLIRNPIPEIRRLIRMLLLSERRGGAYLIQRLDEFTEEAWEQKKKRVRELSETADTKLIFPLTLLLVAVLMIVLAPSLISLG